MKKILMIGLCVLIGLSAAVAQTEKGSRLAGVQVGSIIIPTSGGSGTIIGLQPAYGWFVAHNLVVGAGVPFFHVGSSGASVTQIGLTPFIRYYFGASPVKPYLGASVGVIHTSVRSASSTDAVYSATGGLAFFINRSVSFDFALTYTGGDTGAVNSLVMGGANSLTPNIPDALNINLGFQVYFPK